MPAARLAIQLGQAVRVAIVVKTFGDPKERSKLLTSFATKNGDYEGWGLQRTRITEGRVGLREMGGKAPGCPARWAGSTTSLQLAACCDW